MANIRHFRELKVYQNGMEGVMSVFEISKKRFPAEERFALTDQIRRSSRSVCSNIAEAWRKRRYAAAFIANLSDAEMETGETQVWLEIAFRHGYLPEKEFKRLDDLYEHICAQLVTMSQNPQDWVLRPKTS